jgi:mono/diheme cytochrome c family protein
MTRRPLSVLMIACLTLAACGSAKNNSSWSTAEEGAPIQPPLPPSVASASGMDASSTAAGQAAADGLVPGGSSGRGVGPVDHVDLASLDAKRAAAGAELFKTKCSACHKLNERYVGPALADVTKRREPEWILNMILAPEKMIQQDPTAKALLAQFLAPMANQSLSREEAESILAWFIQNDAASQPSTAEEAAPAGTEPAKTIQGQ